MLHRKTRTAARIVIAAVFLLGGLAVVVPKGTALSSSDFTTVSANATDSPSRISMDQGGTKVGLVYEGTGALTLHFNLQSTPTGAWVQKTADITGAGTRLRDPILRFVPGTTSTWVVFAREHSAAVDDVWRTTDDGATWTNTLSVTSANVGPPTLDMDAVAGHVGITWVDNGVGNVHLKDSADGGVTWGPESCLTDSTSSPGVACSTTPAHGATGVAIRGGSASPTSGPVSWYVAFYMDFSGSFSARILQGDTSDFFPVPNLTTCDSTCIEQGTGTIGASGDRNEGMHMSSALGNLQTTYMVDVGSTNNDHRTIWTGLPGSGHGTTLLVGGTGEGGGANGLDGTNTGNAQNGFLAVYLVSTSVLTLRLRTSDTAQPSTVLSVGTSTVFDAVANATNVWVAYKDPTLGNIKVASAFIGTPALTVAVTNLVGYSMDNAGRTIVARTDGGTQVRTYGVSNLIQVASVATANCNRSDGVNAAQYGSDVYVTYLDCAVGGDSSAFKIRNSALGTPTFPCGQATGDVTNTAIVDVPNALGEIGTISDLNPSYIRTLGASRCGRIGSDEYASVGWTFSEIGTGSIGAWAVTYNSANDEAIDFESKQLDTSSNHAISQLCSWQDPATGKDYVAGSTLYGPTGVYEVVSSVTADSSGGGIAVPHLNLNQKFLNSGIYGAGRGISCSQDTLSLITANKLYVLANVTEPTIHELFHKDLGSPALVQRGVAQAGSANYFAYVDGSFIHIDNKTGVETGTEPIPAGTWRGMEFDNSGEHLAVFTATGITLYNTSALTCQRDNNCIALGGTGDDGQNAADSLTSSSTAACSTPICVDSDSAAAAGFTVAAFNGFLGVLMVGGISAGGYFALGRKAFIAGIFAVIGLLMAYFFGLVPLWVMILLGVGALAVIFISLQRGG